MGVHFINDWPLYFLHVSDMKEKEWVKLHIYSDWMGLREWLNAINDPILKFLKKTENPKKDISETIHEIEM